MCGKTHGNVFCFGGLRAVGENSQEDCSRYLDVSKGTKWQSILGRNDGNNDGLNYLEVMKKTEGRKGVDSH